MTTQQDALAELCSFLEEARLPYMLVGGQANAIWGEPRATLDIDVTIWTGDVEGAVGVLGSRFKILVVEAAAFVRDTRVLPLESRAGVRIDVIFGLLPFEEEAIGRARLVRVGRTEVRVCAPEDLVLMKIISDRERDLSDARGVVARRFEELDLSYLEPRIRELADLLGKPEIVERWNEWKLEK